MEKIFIIIFFIKSPKCKSAKLKICKAYVDQKLLSNFEVTVATSNRFYTGTYSSVYHAHFIFTNKINNIHLIICMSRKLCEVYVQGFNQMLCLYEHQLMFNINHLYKIIFKQKYVKNICLFV